MGCNKIKHVSSSDLEKNCVSTICSYSGRSTCKPGKVFLEDENYFNHWAKIHVPFGTHVFTNFTVLQVLICALYCVCPL